MGLGLGLGLILGLGILGLGIDLGLGLGLFLGLGGSFFFFFILRFFSQNLSKILYKTMKPKIIVKNLSKTLREIRLADGICGLASFENEKWVLSPNIRPDTEEIVKILSIEEKIGETK